MTTTIESYWETNITEHLDAIKKEKEHCLEEATTLPPTTELPTTVFPTTLPPETETETEIPTTLPPPDDEL